MLAQNFIKKTGEIFWCSKFLSFFKVALLPGGNCNCG